MQPSTTWGLTEQTTRLQLARVASATERGIGTDLHQALRPLKRGRAGAKMLLRDEHGNGTADKWEETMAINNLLASKGRGGLSCYQPQRSIDIRTGHRPADLLHTPLGQLRRWRRFRGITDEHDGSGD